MYNNTQIIRNPLPRILAGDEFFVKRNIGLGAYARLSWKGSNLLIIYWHDNFQDGKPPVATLKRKLRESHPGNA
jgi:hypothetical protein